MIKLRKGSLTHKQRLVINLLVTGHTVNDAASIAGISTSVISYWRNNIPLFRETLNEMRIAVRQDQRVQNH